MPANYGNRAHAKIRVQSTCIMPMSVAVRYRFDPWGVPTNCYSMEKDASGRGWCITKFQPLPAFETVHIADTGEDSWQYTAFMNINRTITWGAGSIFNMNNQPCTLDQVGCFQWSWQATGGFETAYSQSFAAVLDCDGYIPVMPPPAPVPAAASDDNALVVIIVGSVLAFLALLGKLIKVLFFYSKKNRRWLSWKRCRCIDRHTR
jgi:hypothetical protein